MSTQEDGAGLGRLFGGKAADHRRRLNDCADQLSLSTANKPPEAARRQGVELLPDRCSLASPTLSKEGLESLAHWSRWPSSNRKDSIRSQDSFAGASTTRSSTFQDTMTDSLGSLSMDSALTGSTLDLASPCSRSNNHSNTTSIVTSPNPSRKNTIDERLDNFVLESNEVKRAKTEHYNTSAALTQMATDILPHVPPHTKPFPLKQTCLADRKWPELMHMHPGMDFQCRHVAPRKTTLGFLALTPDERPINNNQDGPMPEMGSTDLPIWSLYPPNLTPAPFRDRHSPHGKHRSTSIASRQPSSLLSRPITPRTACSSPSTLGSSPENEDCARNSAHRQLIVCDSYGEAYSGVIFQAIYDIILEHTPTAVFEDLEKPLKMAAAFCTEKATNMIQEKLCEISFTEQVARDCSEGPPGSSRPHGPSHTASAPAIQSYFPAKNHGRLSRRQGDQGSGDEADNNEDREGNNLGHHGNRHLLKRHITPYSCPFRKRNPLRFNIREWSSCSFQSFANIASLKRHIKLYHGLKKSNFVCMRCKQDMGRSELLEEHMNVPRHSVCESVVEEPLADPEDGISHEIDKLLCARDSVHKVDSWSNLWHTLFPNDENPPSPEFEPPVDLEEVVNQFNNQQKGSFSMGEERLRLHQRLHRCFDEPDLLCFDPDQYAFLADRVCHEYINKTLQDAKNIPNGDSLPLNTLLTANNYRPIATPTPKKVVRNPPHPHGHLPLIAALPINTPISPLQQTPLIDPANQLPISQASHLPGMSTNFAPFPGHQNPAVGGYLNPSAANAQSGPPSLSESTTSTGSMNNPQARKGSDTPRHHEPSRIDGVHPRNHVVCHTDNNNPLDGPGDFLGPDSFSNTSESLCTHFLDASVYMGDETSTGFNGISRLQHVGGEVGLDPAANLGFQGEFVE